jgi:hypothetical protein
MRCPSVSVRINRARLDAVIIFAKTNDYEGWGCRFRDWNIIVRGNHVVVAETTCLRISLSHCVGHGKLGEFNLPSGTITLMYHRCSLSRFLACTMRSLDFNLPKF